MPDATDLVFGFDRPDADALIKLIGSRTASQLPQSVYDATAMKIGYTTAGATGRSGSTLGKGVFTMYFAAPSGSDRALTASENTDDVTFYNLSTAAVEAAKYIMCLRFGDIWVCIWEDCA